MFSPLLRWALLPFLLLFTASAVILGIRALERLGGRQGSMFDIDLQPILGAALSGSVRAQSTPALMPMSPRITVRERSTGCTPPMAWMRRRGR